MNEEKKIETPHINRLLSVYKQEEPTYYTKSKENTNQDEETRKNTD